MRKLIVNRMKCLLCNDVIESLFTHDYKHCKCGNLMIDGGLSYQRYGWEKENSYMDLSVFADDLFEIVRRYAYRIGYGKSGTKEYGTKLVKTVLCDMTDEHLQASLDYKQVIKASTHWQLLLEEKLYRIENEIYLKL